MAIELFIFAETYEIPELRHDAINRLMHCFSDKGEESAGPWQFEERVVARAYQMTCAGSQLRRVLVAGYCCRNGDQDDTPERMPKQFLVDLANEYKAMKMESDADVMFLKDLDRCDFHGHASEEERATCKATKTSVEDEL